MEVPVYIIIATAFKRTHWLLQRSLYAVYRQEGINPTTIKVLIIDDNEDESEIDAIKEGVHQLRESLQLAPNEFSTRVIKNARTPFMSGTGAWNTGIFLAEQECPCCFISILDDDDEYLPGHLAQCLEQIQNNPGIVAVFQELIWSLPDGNIWEFPLLASDLQAAAFYRGNPGVQGSNLFIQATTLIACGAFDETFKSTTDRDLLIRLFWHLNENPQKQFAIIHTPGVIHHAHGLDRVTTDSEKKHQGLHRFYEKYKHCFTEADYQQSLKRASLLFNYPGHALNEPCMVVLMALHNNAGSVEKAIWSILDQQATRRPLFILVADDHSTDQSYAVVQQLSKSYPNILLFKNQFHSIAQNRNWLQDKAKELFPNCVLIGRLDADDSLAEKDILQRIETYWEEARFDVLLMTNRQYLDHTFTGFVNQPQPTLTQYPVLLQRIQQMSEGVWEAELPSCNVFVNPKISIPFQDVKSGEDHRNLVDYLLRSEALKIRIQPDWIYCNYTIDRHILSSDHEKSRRRKAREELYQYTVKQAEALQRKQKALTLLQRWKPGDYHYLGAGFSGVVFHDVQWVYKVHIPLSTNNFNEADHIRFLQTKLDLFHNRTHFYSLKELTRVEDIYVLVYPFEESEPVSSLSREDMVSFLAEMWQMKVVCRSITKGNNFIRVNGTLKLIDYEIEPYNDNLFLNTAARAFIQLDEFTHRGVSINKLRRSTINNFTLPELDGFDGFVKNIFQQVAYRSRLSKSEVHTPQATSAAPVAYDGKDNPAVSLLIKACIQDSATLYQDVKFLVQQLTQPVVFARRYLLLDVYKEKDFLRQYSNAGNKKQLLDAAERLQKEGIIDGMIIPPDEEEAIASINERWFANRQSFTHTHKGVPVTSQLYAFEEVPTTYFLQMDVDVLIGYRDAPVDYLQGMLAALDSHPNALSIGFQICQPDELVFQPITGQDGSIAPDVRCSLFHQQRLLAARPFENACSDNGWQLPWYRALEQHQQKAGWVSLRGGGTPAYYIHPQNYRKVNRWIWHTLQQSIQHGHLPQVQRGRPEAAGNILDWCLPKRPEVLVVIIYADELNSETLRETLDSMLAQDLPGFGMVLINNTGQEDFGLQQASAAAVPPHRITHLFFEQPVPYNEAIYKAIHYYLDHEDSFVCLLMQGDVLLYPSVLSEVINRLEIYKADVLIGKEISTRTLVHTGMSRSNFLHPRQEPESLANGLAVFRKYLFDALRHLDLKAKLPDAPAHIPAFSKIRQTHQWLNDITNISILVPLVELSSNPIRFDHINVLRTRDIPERIVDEAKAMVAALPAKTEGAWEKGRKTFLPNTRKIELDITYDCNLKCFHCNRSCTQAPTDAHMTLEQVQQFVKESVALGKKWQLINVLGGEPTLHPQFEAIVNCLLYEYIVPHSPGTTLQVTSNGHGEYVQQKLQALPRHANLVIDYNSFKDDRAVPYFTPFNLAPADEPDAHLHEYHKGCWVTAYCGIGLNHLGYFACGVAGGIERILQAGAGISSLAELDQRLQQQLNMYCRLCGNFTAYAANRGDFLERAEKDSAPKAAMSESWRKLYKQQHYAGA